MGAVLQQVSKLVANGTAFHKNGTVVLSHAENVIMFHDYLDTVEPIFKRVDYLLVNVANEALVADSPLHSTIHLSRILLMVSPFLRSLTVLLPIKKNFVSFTFPQLESLTLNFLLPITSAPQLKALHVVIGDGRFSERLIYVATLRSQAPHMTLITIHDLIPLIMLYWKFIDNRIPKDPRFPASIISHIQATPYLNDPVQRFTLLVPRRYVSDQEKLAYLARQRTTEMYSFKIIVLDPGDIPYQGSWKNMFQKAVLQGTGTAEVYAKDHIPQ
jgi:hypothetical protein